MASSHLVLWVVFAAVVVAEFGSESAFGSDTESDDERPRNEVRVVNAAKPAIYRQKENGEDKTLMLRPTPCSKSYDFVHLPANYSMHVTNPSKKGQYRSKLNCGWWIWTMQGYHLEFQCAYIIMQKKDYFFLFDNSTNEWTEFTKTKRGKTELIFNSTDVAAGIYTDRRKNAKGFSCIVSSVPDYVPPTTTTTSATTTTTTPPPPPKECKCGVFRQTRTRITNGLETAPGEYPWMAAISKEKTNPVYLCSAVIITKIHAITLASCVNRTYAEPFRYLTVGMHMRNDTGLPIVRIARISIHPTYARYKRYNLAVLQVPPITFNDRVGPVCLPDDLTVDYAGQRGTVAGWGETVATAGAKNSDVLREVDLPVLSNYVCGRLYAPSTIYRSMVCAQDLDDPSKDFCAGDSGGPLIVNDRGSAELIGLANYGQGCAVNGKPGVYVRVTAMMSYIKLKTRGTEFCPRASGM